MPRGEDQVLELGGRLTGRGSECVVPREWRAHCRAPLVQSGFCLQIAASGRRLRIRVRRFDSCRGHAAETRQGERDVPRAHAATGIRPLDTADPTEAVAAPWPDVLRRSHPGRRLRRADGLGEHSESCRDEVSLNRGICLAVTGAPRRVDGREESPSSPSSCLRPMTSGATSPLCSLEQETSRAGLADLQGVSFSFQFAAATELVLLR
jgi:hypothetical protein